MNVERLSAELRDAALIIEDAREWHGSMTFRDVGAVVYFLRNVPWEVPGFSVSSDEKVLAGLQRTLEREGELRFSTGRLLLVARKS